MVVEQDEEQQTPFLGLSSSSYDSDAVAVTRTGSVWTGAAHIITGVIGAGVLSLAWAMAQLGWIAGPLSMMVFAGVILFAASLLSDCYRYPDPQLGPGRAISYTEAVKVYLGERSQKLSAVISQLNFFGCGIAYTITAATSIRAILQSNCYHREGHDAPCEYQENIYMLLFGALQIVVSQIPDFHNMAWLSVIAAIVSFVYAFIGFGLGASQVIENGRIMGSITGVPSANAADKMWLVFQALGDVAFAYPYIIILLEIQDTLRSPPPQNKTMKKASELSTCITTFFYVCCGCFGYAAFGDATPGNLLTGFYEPYWLIDIANACIVIHLVGGYQIYTQPVFAFVERWISEEHLESAFVNKVYNIQIPSFPAFRLNLFRLCFRIMYVISTTVLSMLFPYFNSVLGLLGALIFWPLTIYFPVEMYIVQKKIGAWTRKWIALRVFSCVCLVVSVLCFLGSVQGIISAKLGSSH